MVRDTGFEPVTPTVSKERLDLQKAGQNEDVGQNLDGSARLAQRKSTTLTQECSGLKISFHASNLPDTKPVSVSGSCKIAEPAKRAGFRQQPYRHD
jgi:hypothetical protein